MIHKLFNFFLMATDSLWVRYAKKLASPDTCLNQWPNSLRNSVVLGPNIPVVSIATGVKKWHESRCSARCTKFCHQWSVWEKGRETLMMISIFATWSGAEVQQTKSTAQAAPDQVAKLLIIIRVSLPFSHTLH